RMGGRNAAIDRTRLGPHRGRAISTHARRPALRGCRRGDVFTMKKRASDIPDATFSFRALQGKPKARRRNQKPGRTSRNSYPFNMTASEFTKIAGRLMRHPSAPFFEHAVRNEVEKICREQKLDFKRDVFGNIIVRYDTAPKTRPFVL